MAYVGYSVTLEDEGRALEALGDLQDKAPQALKNATNATATRAKNMMIRQAKLRYALDAAGIRHVNELKLRARATVAKPSAELFISSSAGDLADFKTNPTQPNMGINWVKSPTYHSGKVLKSEQMKFLTGDSHHSKGFLVQFKSTHIGMVQRVLNSSSDNTVTQRSGRPRWRNKAGNVEILRTYSSPSASAMHSTLWREGVGDEAAEIFQEQLVVQVSKILAKAGRKVL